MLYTTYMCRVVFAPELISECFNYDRNTGTELIEIWGRIFLQQVDSMKMCWPWIVFFFRDRMRANIKKFDYSPWRQHKSTNRSLWPKVWSYEDFFVLNVQWSIYARRRHTATSCLKKRLWQVGRRDQTRKWIAFFMDQRDSLDGESKMEENAGVGMVYTQRIWTAMLGQWCFYPVPVAFPFRDRR